MRTASDYQTPAVPYHTLICRSFSTPNTALVRKNAEYITNTKTPHLVVQPGEMELLNLNLFNRLVSSTSLGNKLIYAQP